MSHFAPAAVYLLCLLTSCVCAGLLLRAYRRGRTGLLLWTAVSFVFLALNNLALVADMIVFPSTDLTIWRQASAAIALAVLLWGFIWEVEP
jgi:cytochrome bd-type quinol oxidase subunit 2